MSSQPAETFQDFLHMDLGQLLSGGKTSPKKLSLLCAQLSISLQAGMPLVSALQLAAKNEPDKRMQATLSDVTQRVRSGEALSDAFQKSDPKLPATFIETIRAGEVSGGLAGVFQRLSVYYEDSASLAAKAGSAMIYPAMLLIVSVAVIAAIMVFAVPVFAQSFSDLGSDLPLPTRILIGISNFFTNNILLLSIAAALGVIGCGIFGKTTQGRWLFGRMALHLPGIGRVSRMRAAAQLSATLSSLLHSGLTLVQALDVTAATMDNPLIAAEIRAARRGVIAGDSLSQGLQKSKYLPNLLTELAAVGEQTGQLEETMSIVCTHFTKEVDTAVKRALSLLEPCITLVLAGLVMFILLSVYLPIFRMYNHL